jgi:hypothetical protein
MRQVKLTPTDYYEIMNNDSDNISCPSCGGNNDNLNVVDLKQNGPSYDVYFECKCGASWIEHWGLKTVELTLP